MYKLIAFVGVVLAGVFVAPVAASAVPYTPGAQVVASVYNLTPGESTKITAGTGFFGGSQSVHVAISGTAASDWSTPASLHSSSSGGVSFTLKAPASSTGHYTVTLTSPSASGSVLLTVTPPGTTPTHKKGHSSSPAGSSSTTGGTTAAGSGSLLTGSTSDANQNDTTQGLDGLSNGSSGTPALTGADMEMIIVWALVALLALLLAFIIVTRIRRREQTES